ncbi:MAG TPA: riboflavin biosynthesis protein RibF [Candidatus Coproplasma avicola]|uniref:Bifunctional riboflavin kinase/FMN adenylyltransferase n=1 Tax=Candidatus Coproplasma avicola TaxID=2840744 RepID=A0A9D1E6B1_9FIRM|nr:riboflavin biosynthesis protein RibF [Candidatus Coproplasma avicola]
MLEIIEYGKDEYAFPSLVVLGCFDAIHAGHRELFKKAKLQAKINGLDLGVMMFRDGKGGKQVYSFEERVAMLSSYNVKFVLVIDYTHEFKQISPIDFLHAIEDKVNVKAYMSGKDFRFGKGAKGKSSTLKNYAEDEDNGVWYMPVKDVTYEGEKISTTLIKSCLTEGNVAKAAAMLGEKFYVEGQVVEGAHRGADILGFPTINITYPDWKYPVKHGVYKVQVAAEDQVYSGIANFGGRPTFDDDKELLEVYIKDFDGDLYGKNVKVSFVGYMRSIRKFADPAELAAQLEQDKAALSLTDEQFNALYPLEESQPAIEEIATAQLEEECTPPAEVFEGAPVQQSEVQTVSEPAEVEAAIAQPAEETEVSDVEISEEIPAEVVSEEVKEEPLAEEVVEETTEEIPAEEIVEETTEETPAEELVEETTEEIPAEEAVEEIIEEVPAEEVVEDTTEEIPAEEVVEETTEEVPAEEAVEEITEEVPAEEITEEVVEETMEEIPAEEVVKETTEEVPAEEVVEETTEEIPAEEVVKETTEEVPAEEVVEETTEEVPAEEVVEETTEEVPAEEVVEEVTEEIPAEEIVEEATEEVPAEEVVEEITEEVPAEEIVEEEQQSVETTDEAEDESAEDVPEGQADEEQTEQSVEAGEEQAAEEEDNTNGSDND